MACGLADVYCSCISNCWGEVVGSACDGDKKLDSEAATDKPSGRLVWKEQRAQTQTLAHSSTWKRKENSSWQKHSELNPGYWQDHPEYPALWFTIETEQTRAEMGRAYYGTANSCFSSSDNPSDVSLNSMHQKILNFPLELILWALRSTCALC